MGNFLTTEHGDPLRQNRHRASDERLAILRAAIARHPTEEITPLYIDWEQVKNELCDGAQNKSECVL